MSNRALSTRIFITNFNRLTTTRKLTEWLLEAGHSNITILDGGSDWPPLHEWYRRLKHVEVQLLGHNVGRHHLWQSGIAAKLKAPYVVTDPDVCPADYCPQDLVATLLRKMEEQPTALKIGPGLRIDNIRPEYQRGLSLELEHWNQPFDAESFLAAIDSTFALYPRDLETKDQKLMLRMGYPYLIEHAPWYMDNQNLSEEELHFRETCTDESSSKNHKWL